MLVVGSGNLAFAVAGRALDASIEVAGVIEIWPEVRGDARVRAELKARGVKFLPRRGISRVLGRSRAEAVELVDADPTGTPIPGSEHQLDVDVVCFAIGASAALELPYLARCQIGFDPGWGGYYPVHDELQRTSAAGVLVAGDGAAFRDEWFLTPEHAAAQGQRAGLTAAWSLGKAPQPAGHAVPSASSSSEPLPDSSHLTPWHRFADLASGDDVVLCLCEGVTRAEVLAAHTMVVPGHQDEVKRVSRAGMGPCQGRRCRATIAGVLAARAGLSVAAMPVPSYRPPVRPLPLGALTTEEERPVPVLAPFARLLATLESEVRGRRLPAIRYSRWRTVIEQANRHAVEEGRTEQEAEQTAADVYARFHEEVEMEPWIRVAGRTGADQMDRHE